MGRIAFVFSGQGDQHPGMGASVCAAHSAAANVFSLCDTLRPGTSSQCFRGSDSELRETKNTQPCLFAMELATAAALTQCGLTPDMAAGFSLGEVSALTFAGALSLENGFSLVCKRGELMQRAAEKHPTTMVAVLKLTPEQVEAVCSRHDRVYPVNYNCPGQVSVSGPDESMPAFLADVKQVGGRALPLKVRGGFHSPFMAEAGAAFGDELRSVTFSQPKIPVYSDVTGAPYPSDIASVLSRQICAPVRWETVIRNMIADGSDAFIEIGPGKTLCNLIARIDPSVRRFAVCDFENLDQLCMEVNAC